MPELPEVQTVVSSVRPYLIGRRIAGVNLTRRDIVEPRAVDLAAMLMGRVFTNVERRGKRIIMTLDDGNKFYIHLGMTGRLTLEGASEPLRPHTHLIVEFQENPPRRGKRSAAPDPHRAQHPGRRCACPGVEDQRDEHAVEVEQSSAKQLRFSDPRRFGGIWWLGSSACDEGMGPEPLTITPKQLAALLARTTRAIKNALLDQSLIAGLGNIYVDESLFTSGIHPLTPGDKLTPEQIVRLTRAIKSVLRKAINHRGSTLRDYRDADGNEGAFQKLHRVYGREDKPCAICKTKIRRIVLGGRSTHFCPLCQPA